MRGRAPLRRYADLEGHVRAERAVGRGVAVAADDRHPRLGEPQLRADDVDDPLGGGPEDVERDPELVAVLLEGAELAARDLVRDLIEDAPRVVGDARERGGAVVHRRHGALGATHAEAARAQVRPAEVASVEVTS